ncbi:MAG: hypothetical protein FWD69_10545 [Polyangiaceae bacterium]|nr:hypothetical protein [Polyangiaceae bacterium]
MAKSFVQLRKYLGPPWLVSTGQSGLIGYSLDYVKDAFVERLRLGHLARFPQQDPQGTPGPPDALAALGRDRHVVKGIDESERSYAYRLTKWLDYARLRGSAFGLMDELYDYLGASTGYPVRLRIVDAQGNWFTREAGGTRSYLLKRKNWEWDDHPIDLISGKRRWSRFWVIVYPAGLWSRNPNWNDPNGPSWNEPLGTWDTTANYEDIQTLRTIIAGSKPGGTRCVNIIVAFDPGSFDPLAAVDAPDMPNYQWEHWSKNQDGVQVPARLTTAAYFQGSPMPLIYTGNPNNNPVSITVPAPNDGPGIKAADVQVPFEGVIDKIAWTQAALAALSGLVAGFTVKVVEVLTSTTVAVPANQVITFMHACGGGGDGGSSQSGHNNVAFSFPGGGGGAGSVAVFRGLAVPPGSSLAVVVGDGGAMPNGGGADSIVSLVGGGELARACGAQGGSSPSSNDYATGSLYAVCPGGVGPASNRVVPVIQTASPASILSQSWGSGGGSISPNANPVPSWDGVASSEGFAGGKARADASFAAFGGGGCGGGGGGGPFGPGGDGGDGGQGTVPGDDGKVGKDAQPNSGAGGGGAGSGTSGVATGKGAVGGKGGSGRVILYFVCLNNS